MEISQRGNLRDHSIPETLVYLNRTRATGTLSVNTPLFTKSIYLIKGDAIFASSSYEDDRLGEMLLKAGKITVEQYDKSVEMLKTTGKRQGAILVELGYLTPKELFWGVKYQVKEIIYSLFQLEDGAYEFEEGDVPTQEVITLKLSMGNLIYEGVKRIDNWTRIRKEMPDTGTVLKLSGDPMNLFQEIELSPQDRKILSLIDGKRTIKEVMDNSWLSSFEALKTLYVLWSIGILAEKRVKDEEEETISISIEEILKPLSEEEEVFRGKVNDVYERLGTLSKSELLGIDETAASGTIKKNYYRLAKEFHPDRCYNSSDASMKDKLTTIFDAITQAYNTLKDDTQREEYSRSPDRVEQKEEDRRPEPAEDQFNRGVEEFKKGNFWGAIDMFKWSTQINPKKALYWSYMSLALSKVPNRLKEAEEALLEAVKLEPFNSEHHVNLGLIYLKAGLKKRAKAQFGKALKFDPGNIKAQKGLEQIK